MWLGKLSEGREKQIQESNNFCQPSVELTTETLQSLSLGTLIHLGINNDSIDINIAHRHIEEAIKYNEKLDVQLKVANFFWELVNGQWSIIIWR